MASASDLAVPVLAASGPARALSEVAYDAGIALSALQRIAAIDSLASFPQQALEIVCDAFGAYRATYSEFGAPGAPSFVYVAPGRPGAGEPSTSVQIPIRTDKQVEIVLTLYRLEPYNPGDRALLSTVGVALAQSHALLRRVDRLARSLSVVAGARRTTTALVTSDGALNLVDGSPSILTRWFRPGSSVCRALSEWVESQRGCCPGTERPFVVPSVDVVLVGYWRGSRRSGDLLEFEEQIYDGADLRCLGLTAREAEILALLVTGAEANAIALRVGSRPATVKKHIESIYRKLCVHSRRDAVTIALEAMMNPGKTDRP